MSGVDHWHLIAMVNLTPIDISSLATMIATVYDHSMPATVAAHEVDHESNSIFLTLVQTYAGAGRS